MPMPQKGHSESAAPRAPDRITDHVHALRQEQGARHNVLEHVQKEQDASDQGEPLADQQRDRRRPE